MKSRILIVSAIISFITWGSYSQCLNGGCDLGLSRAQTDKGIFIGNYGDGKKQGLGIEYVDGASISYSNYVNGEKDGVEYVQKKIAEDGSIVHRFTAHQNGVTIYPSLRITRNERQTDVEVIFDESNGWEKYDGTRVSGNLKVQSSVQDGIPAIVAINGKDVVMAVSLTVSEVGLFGSVKTEKYYNPLQVRSQGNHLDVSLFPRYGAEETFFKTNIDWDLNNPEDGLWLYRKYFNQKLSYKFLYQDVMELPSQQDLKQQKVQKAFEFIAEQVEDYDFDKGYSGKAKDFIDMLNDIKSRALRKGLSIPHIYDITMTKLYLQKGDKEKSLLYAKSACDKSAKNYDVINEMITTKFHQYADLLASLK